MRDTLRGEVWRAMLDADMNCRYWRNMSKRYVSRDKRAKITLAIISSGTVAGWTIWKQVPIVWEAVSVISAVVAIVLPILNFQKIVDVSSMLYGKWSELLREYESYWISIENGESVDVIRANWSKTRAKETPIMQEEVKIPEDQDLLRQCQGEVLKFHRLLKEDQR